MWCGLKRSDRTERTENTHVESVGYSSLRVTTIFPLSESHTPSKTASNPDHIYSHDIKDHITREILNKSTYIPEKKNVAREWLRVRIHTYCIHEHSNLRQLDLIH